MRKRELVVVRGGGDIATGTIHRIHRAGFPVVVLETSYPSAIRRQVSFCEAIYEGEVVVEGEKCIRVTEDIKIDKVLEDGNIPILCDPNGDYIRIHKPKIVVDGILAKRNLGMTKDMAQLTIGLGPGFEAGKDVDVVIETMRGHNLGRILRNGSAIPNTGVPGMIAGHAKDRVIHAKLEGSMQNIHHIGDVVKKGEVIAYIQSETKKEPVLATMEGILRGLIRDGYPVTKGFKIADIDPRKEVLNNCFTISDKARCIAGSVLEVICQEF